MNGAVEIRDVTKTFDRHVAVNDLALTVPTGSVYGFIGPNGSGKTTSLRMIMGIIYPDPGSGSMQVLGKPVSRAANDRVGYMPEERGLYNKMKVRDILRFCAELKGHRDCRGDIDDWLGRLGLGDWSDKKVEALSKGMTQKVQVNAEVVKDAILEVKRGGTTVILSTHDMNVAERMCDFIFMIFKGRKVLDGTLESIQDAYASDTIRVRVEGNGDVFGDLPGVERVNDFGHFQELRTTEQADPQAILHALAARARIRLFELARPSLNDIFVRIAGPEAQEAGHE